MKCLITEKIDKKGIKLKVHDFTGNLVRKSGGVIKETYAMQGGNMNVYIGDDAIKERMGKVRWDEL